MTEDVFAGFAEPGAGELDPLAPEHVAPLVGYLASPAAGNVNGQLLVVHGGMVAVVERPKVAAKFDTAKDAFSYEELDALLTPHYADRAAERDVRRGRGARPQTRLTPWPKGPGTIRFRAPPSCRSALFGLIPAVPAVRRRVLVARGHTATVPAGTGGPVRRLPGLRRGHLRVHRLGHRNSPRNKILQTAGRV